MGAPGGRQAARKPQKLRNKMFVKGNKLHLKRLQASAKAPNETDSRPPQPMTRRYTKSEFDCFVKDAGDVFSIPDVDGNEGTARILRCKKEKPALTKPTWITAEECNIIVEINMFMSHINKAIKEHSQSSPSCTCLDMKLSRTEPVGCYIRTAVKCANCSYESKKEPMYAQAEQSHESSPGPRAAKGNIRLGYMLLLSSIGPTKLRFFLAGLGVRPISRTRLQELTVKAAERAVKENKKDMNKWLKYAVKVLEDKGVENTKTINVASDGRYDGCRKASSVTPGAGATAATGVFVEQVTGAQKIVDLEYVSKRCPMGTTLQGTGIDPKCGTDEKHRFRL